MDGFSGNLLSQPQLCRPPYPPTTMEMPFKVDEGYSEDTRSQDEGDTPMGIEPRVEEMMGMVMPPLAGLSDAVMTLNEAERSGEAVYLV